MKARLYEKYTKEVREALKDKLKKKNVHEVPRLEKIVINPRIVVRLPMFLPASRAGRMRPKPVGFILI